MKFIEKNNFVVKHTSVNFFEKDYALFKEVCPESRLHADLKRVNSFTKQKLDGMMLLELLDKVSPEIILNNRKETSAVSEDPVIETEISSLQETEAFSPAPAEPVENEVSAVSEEPEKETETSSLQEIEEPDSASAEPAEGEVSAINADTEEAVKKKGTNKKSSQK